MSGILDEFIVTVFAPESIHVNLVCTLCAEQMPPMLGEPTGPAVWIRLSALIHAASEHRKKCSAR